MTPRHNLNDKSQYIQVGAVAMAAISSRRGTEEGWGRVGGKLIRLADERRDSVNRQDGITFVTSADSWLPLPLCVSSNYTGTYRSGRQRGVGVRGG